MMKTANTDTVDRDHAVRITEIYASVQGESTHAGRACTFIRLTGCNLRCVWCDTTYSFTGGDWWSNQDVLAQVEALGVSLVEVTGGEPLVQRGAIGLMSALLERGYEVLLETSGSRSIQEVPDGVRIILDLKAPGSGEHQANVWSNLDLLDEHDEIKIVLASRDDYDWAREMMAKHRLADRCKVLLSPVHGDVDPAQLVGWMLHDRVPARLNVQLHKHIWPPDQKGV